MKSPIEILRSGITRGIDIIIEGISGWTIGCLMFCWFFVDRVVRYSLLVHYMNSTVFNSSAIRIESFSYKMVFGYCIVYCLCFCLYHFYHQKKPAFNNAVILQFAFFLTVIYSTEINYGSTWTEDVFRGFAVKDVFLTCVFFFAIGNNTSSRTIKQIIRFCCWTYIIVLTYTNLVSLMMSFKSDSTGLIDLFSNYNLRVILRLEPPSASVIWPHRFKGFYGNATSLGIRECITILCAEWLRRNEARSHSPVKIITATVMILAFYLLLLSECRTALVCILVMILFGFTFLLQKKMKPSASYIITSSITLLLCAVIIIKHFAFFDTLVHTDFTIPNEGVDRVTSFRSQIIREMLAMNHRNSIFGAGWYTPFGTFETAHNYLMNVIGWTGYAGLILISVSSLLIIIRVIKNRRIILEDQWMMCILICIWIISMLDQGILGTTNSPYVYLFYLIAGYLSSPSSRKEPA